MKKVLVIIAILSFFVIGGCTQSKDFTIAYKEFTDEQYETFSLTGNRAFKYDLKNIPNDKSYELNIVYEVYKNNEKIKEKSITGMRYEPTNEKIEDSNIAINIQGNKIRLISGAAYSDLDIEEDIYKLNNYYFSGSRNINIGDEVTLFHGNDKGASSTTERLGLLSKEELDEIINKNEVNVLIKLVCKEIAE